MTRWEVFSQRRGDWGTRQKNLKPDIKLYMKKEKHGKVIKRLCEFKSKKRINGFGKPVLMACNRAFISALKSQQDRPKKEGGNAVIDIYSITKDKPFDSAEEYSCTKGGVISNVALMGTVAELSG